ncbi:hypothetical protein, partial [Vibrio antiquarius]
FNKELFEYLNSDVINEDRVLPLRALYLNGISYIDEPLVKRRYAVGLGTLNKGLLKNKTFKLMEVHYTRRISCLNQQIQDANKYGYGAECLDMMKTNLQLAELFFKVAKDRNFLNIKTIIKIMRLGAAQKYFYWMVFWLKSYVKRIIG